LLYGAGGLPLGDAVFGFAAEQYEKANGAPLTPEAWRVMSKGFWDTAMYHATGGELVTDFSGRVGQGSAMNQMWERISSGELSSWLEVMGGATGSIASKMWDTSDKLALYFRAEQVDVLSPQVFGMVANDVMKNINSFNRAEKGYFIWKLGTLIDQKTGNPIVDATTLEGFAAVLGIPLREETERWDIINDREERQAYARKIAEVMANNIRLAIQAMNSGDQKGLEQYSRMASGLMMSYRDDPLFQQEILRERNQILNYGRTQEWDNIQKQLFMNTGKQPQGGQ